MLTEAVCARHQPHCSEEEMLRVAENQSEKQGEQQGKPLAMEGGSGGWGGRKMGYAPFALRYTAQLKSIRMAIKE